MLLISPLFHPIMFSPVHSSMHFCIHSTVNHTCLAVSVGYEYTECKKIFWEVKSAAINGFDISSSELGKWNLNIHHAYNYQDGERPFIYG